MKKWKIVYQDVPYNYTSPRTLVIEADSREAALVTAYDHLTRKGFAVATDSIGCQEINLELLKSLGWPEFPGSGDTRIRSIVEHTPVVTGMVLEQR